MKKLFFSISLLFASLLSLAEVRPGDNIVQNGRFELNQSTIPMCWITGTDSAGILKASNNAGPEGLPAITYTNNSASRRSFTIRQFGLNLKEGETYRISARVRTKDLKYGKAGIIIANVGWLQDAGIKKLPANCDWTLFQEEVTAMPAKDGKYFIAVFTVNFTGELSVADLRLEAISEGALKYTEPSDSDDRALRIVPWEPLLDRIPADNPTISFNFFGRLPTDNYNDYSLVVKAEGAKQPVVQNLVKNVNTVKLPAGAKGGKLEVAVIRKETGKALLNPTFHYTIMEFPNVSDKGHKVLNNLVSEVVNSDLKATNAPQSFRFDTVRDGWLFIVAENASANQNLHISLDADNAVIDTQTPRLEAFRLVPMGHHTITVKGAEKGGRIIVRAIAEVFDYCPGNNSFVPTNPPYDWEFQKKYLHPAVTTFNGGILTDEQVAYIRKNGQRWMGSVGTKPMVSTERFMEVLNGAKGLYAPQYCGVTCDEQFFGQHDALLRFIAGLRQYNFPEGRDLYSWFVGKPTAAGLDNDVISACVNVTRGRGKILSELYSPTMPDEASARKHMENFIIDTVRMYKKHFPHIEEHLGVILGNFNQVPLISVIHHPEVDYKYFLDMQLNLIANHPELKNIACTGYWGSYYGDHELHRWSMLLLRHYCVEGRRDMLSDQYGYSYIPNHLQNGDFRGSLDGWKAVGNVSTTATLGFSNASEARWSCLDGTGDTYAVMTKKADETTTLSQVIKGLVPGKAYCLQFAVFDTAALGVNPVKSRALGIEATIDGVTIRPDLTWHYVNNRRDGSKPQASFAPINLHHIVFIANGPEATLTLSNAKALTGEALGVNMVSLNPFLMEP